MRLLIAFLAISLSITNLALGESQTKRFLYLSTPDGLRSQAVRAPVY